MTSVCRVPAPGTAYGYRSFLDKAPAKGASMATAASHRTLKRARRVILSDCLNATADRHGRGESSCRPPNRLCPLVHARSLFFRTHETVVSLSPRSLPWPIISCHCPCPTPPASSDRASSSRGHARLSARRVIIAFRGALLPSQPRYFFPIRVRSDGNYSLRLYNIICV